MVGRIRARSTDGLTTTTRITQTSDPFSRTIAALALWTSTTSPGSVGAEGARMTGLQGQGAHKSGRLTAPMQNFLGFAKPVRVPGTALTGYKMLGNGLPSTGTSTTLGALLSQNQLSSANYLHGYGG